MKSLVFAVALAALATGAWAQTASPPPDPARMDLARQIVAASGGEAKAEAQIRMIFGALEKGLAQNLPPEESRLQGPIYDSMVQQVVKITPQILEVTTRAYANNFTETELRDLLAFQASETGKAMVRKAPAIQAEVMSESLPLIMKLMPQIMRESVERACAAEHCTPAQRQAIDAAIAKSVKPPAG
jgi:hypothetical protein